MKDILYTIAGIFIPFLGTSLGSGLVFFLKNKINEKFHKLMIGFAAGVMIAASVWSLIIPAVEKAEEQGKIAWLPATIGLVLGVIFLLFIGKIARRHESKKNGKKINMLMFSVTLHNIPEGMAVGVCFAGFLQNAGIGLVEAMVLAIGIGVQNIPEGAIISLPLKIEGESKGKSFCLCNSSKKRKKVTAIFEF